MVIDKDFIPELVSNHSFVRYNDHTYTLCIDDAKPIKLNINKVVKELLEEIDGVKNIEQVTRAFNEKSRLGLSVNDAIAVFDKHLLGYGILKGDNLERLRITNDYIKFKITLIPSAIVRKVTPLLEFLFQPRVFTILFTTCTAFLVTLFALNVDVKTLYHEIDPFFVTVFTFVNILSLILHEFGHAAACDRFGARSGSIGFGFYVFTPVFYSDVSDSWRLKKMERIIVDLGGIYIQLIICALFAGAYLVSSQHFYLHMSYLMAIALLINVNPFMRYDGYWTLCDLVSIVNLRSKSMEAVGMLTGRLSGLKNKWKPTSSNIFLVIYGLLSVGFLVFFILYMIIFNHRSILYFPVNLYSFFETLIVSPENVNFRWVKDSLAGLIIPAIFYYLLIKIVVKKVKEKYFRSGEKI